MTSTRRLRRVESEERIWLVIPDYYNIQTGERDTDKFTCFFFVFLFVYRGASLRNINSSSSARNGEGMDSLGYGTCLQRLCERGQGRGWKDEGKKGGSDSGGWETEKSKGISIVAGGYIGWGKCECDETGCAYDTIDLLRKRSGTSLETKEVG